jgi:hypothetical protein
MDEIKIIDDGDIIIIKQNEDALYISHKEALDLINSILTIIKKHISK